jgi:NAD(P)-dependent dehydrogenase (short-subunit alcohol dehydrogenase family)
MSHSPRLAGNVAIISGGLGDIGRSIALELAERGADIALGDVLPAGEAAEMLSRVQSLGRRALYTTVDVSDAEAVTAWVKEAESALGVPTLVIPNAAIVTLKRILEITPSEWRREMNVNLDGSFYLAQAAANRMRAHNLPGRIVFIGSWAAHTPHGALPAYCVTKAGLRMLVQSLALDLARYGILVNEVAPGYVDAGLSGKIYQAQPELRVKGRNATPVHELILPEEVAYEVAHLCDAACRQITGSTILMDGGLSLRSPSDGIE